MNNLSIHISTINGTGSLSANEILTRILFREGLPSASYNFFPSNIAGLPCVYTLRINSRGYAAYTPTANWLVSLNPKTALKDLKNLKPDGVLVMDKKHEKAFPLEAFKGTRISLPLTEAVGSLPDIPLRMKKFFKNMIYVGLLCEWLNISREKAERTVSDFFQRAGKPSAVSVLNINAINKGRELGRQNPISFSPRELRVGFSDEEAVGLSGKGAGGLSDEGADDLSDEEAGGFSDEGADDLSGEEAGDLSGKEAGCENPASEGSEREADAAARRRAKGEKKILIDGNTAVALGALSAGCGFVSWYPITPSSSLAESFEKFANKYQRTPDGKKKFVVLQAEDELSAFHHVLGAGWAGLRAMTATSGPGLSLMAEGVGLAFFAEVPLVLCNVQRAGPSTGLPTRTGQGDLLSVCFLSHGDTRHPVLIPGSAEECFSFSAKAFDLAEKTQTPVVLLMDLDLGMNLQTGFLFKGGGRNLNRGKILTKEALEGRDFARYRDEDRDGVSYRALPGTPHSKAGYFTRGSGHDEKAQYTEDPEAYALMQDKLKRKWETLKFLVPDPLTEMEEETSLAFVTFGNNEKAVREARDILKERGIRSNFMRIRSFPFTRKVEAFLERHGNIFVVEQNRDGQLKKILSGEFPLEKAKMKSILQYDGRPFFAQNIIRWFEKQNGIGDE